MEKKMEMAKNGVQIAVAIGVSTLVGGALAIVKPKNLGVIRKVTASIAGFVLSSMVIDSATDYVEKQFDYVVASVSKLFKKEDPKEETEETEEVQA